MDDLHLPICVLIANMPRLVAHTLAHLVESQPDMTLLGLVEGQIEVLLVASDKADVVILGTSNIDSIPGLIDHLLGEYPHLKILTLSSQDNLARGYWLDIRRGKVTHVTSDSFLRSVRELHKHVLGQ